FGFTLGRMVQRRNAGGCQSVALLDDVRQFMGKQSRALSRMGTELAFAEHDVGPGGVSEGADRARRRVGRGAGVNADVFEVGAERGAIACLNAGVERRSARGEL